MPARWSARGRFAAQTRRRGPAPGSQPAAKHSARAELAASNCHSLISQETTSPANGSRGASFGQERMVRGFPLQAAGKYLSHVLAAGNVWIGELQRLNFNSRGGRLLAGGL